MTTPQKLAIAADAADRLDALARVGLHEIDPAALYDIAGNLARLVDALGTVASLTGYRCGQLANRPDLGADDLGPTRDPAAIAQDAANAALETVHDLACVARALHETHNKLSRLYLDPTGERGRS